LRKQHTSNFGRPPSNHHLKRSGAQGFDLETWKAKRESIVYVGCREKFTQYPGLRTLLLATAPTELVEAGPYDVIWGVGLSERHPDITDKSKWRGQNLPGKALMRVRDALST
jgi:ribA/ribD-fused uncharacterized protein